MFLASRLSNWITWCRGYCQTNAIEKPIAFSEGRFSAPPHPQHNVLCSLLILSPMKVHSWSEAFYPNRTHPWRVNMWYSPSAASLSGLNPEDYVTSSWIGRTAGMSVPWSPEGTTCGMLLCHRSHLCPESMHESQCFQVCGVQNLYCSMSDFLFESPRIVILEGTQHTKEFQMFVWADGLEVKCLSVWILWDQ